MASIPAELCIQCKASRYLCGWEKTTNGVSRKYCPLLAKLNISTKFLRIGEEFYGPSEGIFIGRSGYPNVFSGPVASLESALPESPSSWFGLDYTKIIEARSMTLRSMQKENIFSRSRLVSDIQELALAKKPVHIEETFSRKPVYKISLSPIMQPMGPSVELKQLRLTENVSINKSVEKIISDDLSAASQASLLFSSGEDLYKITTVLSSGILGRERSKKLVPTRWSITAMDDILTKSMIEEIKKFPVINDYQIFHSEYLGNSFHVFLIPASWEYEGFETWSPGSFWSQGLEKPSIVEEYEPYTGRKTYAEKQGGGYYAARFSVVEALQKMRKQARVIVFREISDKYSVPLGVWVVRETVRNAMRSKPARFQALKEAFSYIDSRLCIKISEYAKKSVILKRRTLLDF